MEPWLPWVEIPFWFALAFLLVYRAVLTRRHPFVAAPLIVVGVLVSCIAGFSALQNLDRDSELRSPNGTYVAHVIVGGGPFLYPSQTRVTVRRRDRLTWQVAYSGPGWSAGGGEASHYLEWADNTHLVIHYHGIFPSPCPFKLNAVFIECRSHIW